MFLASLLAAGHANADSVIAYSTDFDGTTVVGAGIVTVGFVGALVQSVQGYAGVNNGGGSSFGGNFLSSYNTSNDVSTLTLSELPDHTSLDIDGLIAAMDSWDSDDGSCCTPDYLVIRVDGVTVFQDTYNTALGTHNNLTGLVDIGGGKVSRGFLGSWADQAFDLGATLHAIAHVSDTVVIQISGEGAGWQTDEDWGLENLSVTLNGVTPIPLPVPFVLMASALAALGVVRGRHAGRHS